MRHDGAHEAIDERRLQAQLLGIRDVLPGAATRADARRGIAAEVPACGRDPMGRRAQNVEQGGGGAPAIGDTNADALTRDGERHRDAERAGGRHAVAVGVERLDLDVCDVSTGERSAAEDLPAGARSARAGQLTFSSSTSKTSVAFGGMTPPAPCDP